MTYGDVTGYPPLRVCPKCGGRGDAHYLTCPTLRLPRSWWLAAKRAAWS
jgi:hypothetical protein